MNGRLKRLVACLGAVAFVVVPGALGSPALTVTILTNPPNPSTSSDARFTWRANETATFTCSLDGARPTACMSPASYTGLAAGLHDFVVVATNRDRAGTVFTARDTYRWRIDLAGPPPPPRPAPDRVTLLVTIEGDGKVTSSPSGISCPGDCQESFVLGTPVTLSQQASSGLTFTGWNGACSGAGGCALVPTAPTLVKAEFDPAGKPVKLALGDPDADGVPAGKDRCPGTARAAKAVLGGCAHSDLPSDKDAFDSQIEAMLDNNRWFLRVQTKVANVDTRLHRLGRGFATHIARIEDALDDAGDDMCGSAEQLTLAARGLGAGAKTSKALLTSLQKAIQKEPAAGGDADSKDLRWAALHRRQGLTDALVKDAARLRGFIVGACDALGPRTMLAGRVTETNEADGVVEIDDQVLVSFEHGELDGPIRVGDLWEGARVKVPARRLGPIWLPESITVVDKALPKLTLNLQPCVKLLFAPAQDWADPTPLLHNTRGYKSNGSYWLEEGMRVAASFECASAKPQNRYSLKVEATAPGGPKLQIAEDLTASDGPVPLPIPAAVGGAGKGWTLTVTERRQASDCFSGDPSPLQRTPSLAAKSYPCPIVPLGTTTYAVRMRVPAFYATAVFQKKALPVEANGYAQNKVTGLSGVHFTLGGTGASFEGVAYKASQTQIPSAFELTKTNETFIVLADSWYGPQPLVDPLAAIGVDHLAGVVWPRVVGTRNGKPYSYRAQLPLLSKDLLLNCATEKCLYRLPWKFGTFDNTSQATARASATTATSSTPSTSAWSSARRSTRRVAGWSATWSSRTR